MARLFTMGECLIDFVALDIGVELKEVSGFLKMAGGAPANVAACASKLGIESFFIGKLGEDAFGDFLVNTMEEVGINISCVSRTNEANTALAFVSLKQDGKREFSFYRKPSADMLLDKDDINCNWFEKGDILQFCSVDLIEAPVKYAHKKAIELVKEKDGTIIFDPNLRFPLWENKFKLKEVVLEYIKYSDIVKISDEELEFITGEKNEEKASKLLFDMGVKVFIYTMGKDGAKIFTKDFNVYHCGYKVKAMDTTGAGDSFLGAYIAKILLDGMSLIEFTSEYAKDVLSFANACGAIVSTKKGAINSMASINEINELILTVTKAMS
jgi:fructokinase